MDALTSCTLSNMKKHYDAIIIGGGAAGLMCAWQAGLRGHRVVVLERSKKIGRKILMSGGGRCNFTNLYVEADNFISANPHFVKSALSRYTAWDFIASVQAHNIAYHERDHGQLFCDDKAKDIVTMLSSECASVGVDIVTQCVINQIDCESANEAVDFTLPDKNPEANKPAENLTDRHNSTDTRPRDNKPQANQNYRLQSNQGVFEARSLVVATGGLSIPYMDPTPFGYDIARQFGLTVLPQRASLVPYTFSGALKDMFARLSGNAIPVVIEAGKQRFQEALLFTHRGLSGPVVLQISNYWQQSDPIHIDLLPDINLTEKLLDAKNAQPKSLARTIISRLLPKNVVLELEALWWSALADRPMVDWPNNQIERVGQLFNQWEIVPSGTEGYRTAEVTLGGVDTNELSSRTMQANSQPGLYFIGEVVDVTGHLGGFNFQWAWSSAYVCANALR